MTVLAVVEPLTTGVDTDSFVTGFALGLVLALVFWAALIGLYLVRRLLSE